MYLLFLPAAGWCAEANGERTFVLGGSAIWSRVARNAELGYNIYFTWATFFGDGRQRDRRTYNSVRLASVVSEGLTQTWKCHIVFGIGCPRLSF